MKKVLKKSKKREFKSEYLGHEFRILFRRTENKTSVEFR